MKSGTRNLALALFFALAATMRCAWAQPTESGFTLLAALDGPAIVPGRGTGFGASVAITPDGETAAIGARGSVEVLDSPGEAGSALGALSTAGVTPSSQFGDSLVLSDDGLALLVADPLANDGAAQVGSVYLFSRDSTASQFSGGTALEAPGLASFRGLGGQTVTGQGPGRLLAASDALEIVVAGMSGSPFRVATWRRGPAAVPAAASEWVSDTLAAVPAAGDGDGVSPPLDMSLSADGQVLAVAYGSSAGVYVFRLASSGWTLEQNLIDDCTVRGYGSCGEAVALSGAGLYLVFSALLGSDGGGANFIYRAAGGGAWTLAGVDPMSNGLVASATPEGRAVHRDLPGLSGGGSYNGVVVLADGSELCGLVTVPPAVPDDAQAAGAQGPYAAAYARSAAKLLVTAFTESGGGTVGGAALVYALGGGGQGTCGENRLPEGVEEDADSISTTVAVGGPAVAVTAVTVVAATAPPPPVAAGGPGVGGGTAAGGGGAAAVTTLAQALLAFAFNIQLFIIPLRHNDDLQDLYQGFSAYRFLSGSVSDPDDTAPHKYCVNLLPKAVAACAVVLAARALDGARLDLCRVSAVFRFWHFTPLIALLVNPVLESIFLLVTRADSRALFVLVVVAALSALVTFVAFAVAPRLRTRRDRAFFWMLPPGRGPGALAWRAPPCDVNAPSGKDGDSKQPRDPLTVRPTRREPVGARRSLAERLRDSCSCFVRSNHIRGRAASAAARPHDGGDAADHARAEDQRHGACCPYVLARMRGGGHRLTVMQDGRRKADRAMRLARRYAGAAHADEARHTRLAVLWRAGTMWERSPLRFVLDHVVLYRRPRAGSRLAVSAVYPLRARLSVLFPFVTVFWHVCMVAVALGADGGGQLAGLMTLTAAHTALVVMVAPFRNPVMHRSVFFGVLLFAQYAGEAVFLGDRTRTDAVYFIAAMQLLMLPVDVVLSLLLDEYAVADLEELAVRGAPALPWAALDPTLKRLADMEEEEFELDGDGAGGGGGDVSVSLSAAPALPKSTSAASSSSSSSSTSDRRVLRSVADLRLEAAGQALAEADRLWDAGSHERTHKARALKYYGRAARLLDKATEWETAVPVGKARYPLVVTPLARVRAKIYARIGAILLLRAGERVEGVADAGDGGGEPAVVLGGRAAAVSAEDGRHFMAAAAEADPSHPVAGPIVARMLIGADLALEARDLLEAATVCAPSRESRRWADAMLRDEYDGGDSGSGGSASGGGGGGGGGGEDQDEVALPPAGNLLLGVPAGAGAAGRRSPAAPLSLAADDYGHDMLGAARRTRDLARSYYIEQRAVYSGASHSRTPSAPAACNLSLPEIELSGGGGSDDSDDGVVV